MTISDLLTFFKTVGQSKKLLRSGWVREKIADPESVAEHAFRVSVLALVLGKKLNVDREKLLKMALIHDLGEVVTGDIVTIRWEIVDVKAMDAKEREEGKAIGEIFESIEGGEEYVSIWDEMVNMRSREAHIFWQLDKLEMAIQALEYEEEQGKDLEEFFVSADLYMQDPFLKKIFHAILRKRKKRSMRL